MKKFVIFGGGHGLMRLAEGIKIYEKLSGEYFEKTFILPVTDSGGSTGELRKLTNFKIIPVGDFRKIIITLAKYSNKNAYEFTSIFNEKFFDHKIGNLILLKLIEKYGVVNAFNILRKLLGIKEKIYPVCERGDLTLYARTIDNQIVEGEWNIENQPHSKIIEVWIEPEAEAEYYVIKEIENADLIIFSPGSLYGSVISCILYKNLLKKLNKVNIPKIVFLNLKRDIETTGLDNILELCSVYEKYVDIDLYIANNKIISKDHYEPIYGINKILYFDLIDENNCKYHDPEKIAKYFGKILNCLNI